MPTENLHELAPGYALDALDEAERAAFDAHLAQCPSCREEVAALGAAAGALAFAADAPPPPPGLRERILEAARAEGPPNVIPLRARRRWVVPAGGIAAVASAAALAIGLWQGLDSAGSGRVAATLVRGRAQVSLRVEGLKPAPPGKLYEIWVIDAGGAKPAGTFAGGGIERVPLTRPVPRRATVAVTLERAPGVAAPTSKPLVSTQADA